MRRHYTLVDKILGQVDNFLSVIATDLHPGRANPAHHVAEPLLTEAEKKRSEGLMRVNHVGEICAQALYQGQSMVAKADSTRETLEKACQEEMDHLAWTHERLKELGGRRSYLNPFWYGNAFTIGLIAGILSDKWSLGFVEETERQVSEHLADHLGKLPAADTKSRAIVAQMKKDEDAHGLAAHELGAEELPEPIKKLMKMQAKIMTSLAYWV
jgi:ubiquinone biosynthesis monooxygenase Coq7